jgi:hypothetical protein
MSSLIKFICFEFVRFAVPIVSGIVSDAVFPLHDEVRKVSRCASGDPIVSSIVMMYQIEGDGDLPFIGVEFGVNFKNPLPVVSQSICLWACSCHK